MPPKTASRTSHLGNIAENPDGSNTNLLATPHAALSYAMSGNRSMYELPSAKLPHAEMERIIFRKKIGKFVERIDFNEALKESGCGRFQIIIFLTCGLIYFTCSASATTLSFTLPASKCDLELSSQDMGIIHTSPLIGMIVGTFIWGPMSDTRGRRLTLIVCLTVDLLATILASFAMNKWVLLFARSINGCGIIGATSLVFAYLGEFLTHEKRDKTLISLELFYNLGVIYIPGISWLILPLPVNAKLGEHFYYHSWNLFTLATGISGLISIILLLTLASESPRYLLMKGRIPKMQKLLLKMYKINAKKDTPPYSVEVRTDDPRYVLYFGTKFTISKGYLRELFHQFKLLFGKNTRTTVMQICLIDFFVCFSYLPLLIWIPELLHRRDIYLENVGDNESVSLCYASHHVKSEDNIHTLPEKCIQTITTDVYVDTLIICAACLPTVFFLYFSLMYVPKKILIVVLMCLSGCATLAIAFVRGSKATLAMFCLFEAFSTIIETIVFVCTVEMLPTTVSGTALACIVTSGRLGAVLGNIIIGYLVDTNCDITFYTMAASFISGAIVSLTLPHSQPIVSHRISFTGPLHKQPHEPADDRSSGSSSVTVPTRHSIDNTSSV